MKKALEAVEALQAVDIQEALHIAYKACKAFRA